MIFEYEGTDISGLVTMDRCVYDARDEGRVPRLSIDFEDEYGRWDSWSPQPGDRVSIRTSGAAPTGTMYVKSCKPVSGGYELRADALPTHDAPSIRVWNDTTLSAVVSQLATVLGLKPQYHGCDDMRFTYVRQRNEGALPVIARVCTLAGCTFDVHDGVLHVCSRAWAEAQDSVATLVLSSDSDYEYIRRPLYTSCRITQTEISGVRPGISATYGDSGRELAIELEECVGFPGSRELERACAGILACANARLSGGHVEGSGLTPLTPGAVCAISCEKSPSLSGAAVVTRVRNDFANGKSKVWWR